MTSALMIGPTEREKIAELRAIATANPFNPVDLQATADRDMTAFRDYMKTRSIMLPVDFSVTYTHEVQPNAPPPGLCHHISISLEQPGGLPSVTAVELILAEFGMAPISKSEGIWIEDIAPGERAVNILQLIVA